MLSTDCVQESLRCYNKLEKEILRFHHVFCYMFQFLLWVLFCVWGCERIRYASDVDINSLIFFISNQYQESLGLDLLDYGWYDQLEEVPLFLPSNEAVFWCWWLYYIYKISRFFWSWDPLENASVRKMPETNTNRWSTYLLCHWFISDKEVNVKGKWYLRLSCRLARYYKAVIYIFLNLTCLY